MKTREFVEALKSNPSSPLSFVFESGAPVQAGYHITEVKNIHVESVDCGGAVDAWDETVIQLWLPAVIDPNHDMPGRKASKILNDANKLKPMKLEATCLFEVEEEAGTAVIYRPTSVEIQNGIVTVQLASRKTQCKANDRADAQAASACCSPAEPAKRCC